MWFGERIRVLRKKQRLTQQKLAERLNISLYDLSKFENARLYVGDYPSEKFVYRLAEALDTDEDELLLLTESSAFGDPAEYSTRPKDFRELDLLNDKQLDGVL
tara:strand:- start:506 stop:814 length:309 start_codon:yes stop_codon:yes gene_type:complete